MKVCVEGLVVKHFSHCHVEKMGRSKMIWRLYRGGLEVLGVSKTVLEQEDGARSLERKWVEGILQECASEQIILDQFRHLKN